MRYFERKTYRELTEWKHTEGRTALLIEGARRIGKTTLVEKFAEDNYDTHITINFSLPDNEEVMKVMRHYGANLDMLFTYLTTKFNIELHERRSLIVFDEVQMFPLARQMIKQLVADGRYDYIETGSLISIRQNMKDIVIPSEEHRIQMHPMDFEEFLWAHGDRHSMDAVKEAFDNRKPLPEWIHRNLMNLFGYYMVTGGMPQSVLASVETRSIRDIEEAKRNILELYREDLSKVPARLGAKTKRIMDGIPSMLNRKERVFTPSSIKAGTRTRDYLDGITWLEESKMVNICHRIIDPDPAPGMHLDDMSFKIYMADTGLLFTSAFDSNIAEEEIRAKFITGDVSANRGMFFENVVAQELTSVGRALIFARFAFDGSNNTQELDFLIMDGNAVIPIEVKSAYSKAHKSLDRFREKYSASKKMGECFVIHTKNLEVDGDTTYIPVYMTQALGRRADAEPIGRYQEKWSRIMDSSLKALKGYAERSDDTDPRT